MKLLVCTQVVDKNHPILGFFHGWILEFSKHFSEVHVICLQKGEYLFPPHVYVYSLGKEEGESRLKYVYRFYTYFGHIFFHVKVDYVFFHMGAIYNIVAAPFFCIRKLFATKFYWWKTHGYIGLQSRIALFFVDRVYTAAEVSFPVETKKKYVIGHAINTDVPLSSNKEAQIKKTILFVGRVSPVKNIEYVLQTAEILRKKGIDFCVRIVGPSPDAQYKTSLEKMIVDLDLSDVVTFAGSKSHGVLNEEYTNADILINPSRTGGIDKVVLEAMSWGTPVVALEATYGTILNGFGLTIKEQDAFLYAKVVEKIFDVSQVEKEALRTALRTEVHDHHSLDTLTKRIFNI